MNRVKNEFKWFLKKNRSTSAILYIILIVSFTLCLFSANFNLQINQETNKYNRIHKDFYYYQLMDSLEGDLGKTFEHSSDALFKQLSLYNKLNSIDDRYLEFSESYQIQVLDFKGNDKFLSGYESGINENERKFYVHETEKGYSYSVKGAMVSYNIFEEFGMSTVDGSWFSTDDFDTDSDIIPVVLGNEYSNVYKVGDTFEIDTCFSKIKKAKVIGILKEKAIISKQDKLKNVDRYILYPSLNIHIQNISSDELNNLRIPVYCKLTGIIKSRKSANVLNTQISQMCTELDIPPVYYIIGSTNNYIEMFNTDINEIANAINAITILIFIFSVFLMIVILVMYIKNNLKYFSILLISGFKYSDIHKFIYAIPIRYCLRSYILSLLINLIGNRTLYMKNNLYMYLVGLFAAFTVAILCGFIANKIFDKYDISYFIRKK